MADKRTEDIISRLDVFSEYESMGLRFSSRHVRENGMAEAYSISRDEKTPSAAVNISTGRYIDSANSDNFSLWEFAVKYGNLGLADWKAARDHFAKKCGIDSGKQKKQSNPLDRLEFLDWNSGNDRLASVWCIKHKRGVTLEAIKFAGGRPALFPCRMDKETGKRILGDQRVVALPVYGPKLLAADPMAWVIWNMSGGDLTLYRGRNKEPLTAKMLSVGPTRGGVMGPHAIRILSDPAERAKVSVVIKTAGPSDMLAIIAAQPPGVRDRHLVITNASTETGDILRHQIELFEGCEVLIVHDADNAGEIGAQKWFDAATACVRSSGEDSSIVMQKVVLPYEVLGKKGKDARDFLVENSANAAT
jgi:hypothetical protein